jgi:hypothetical protein
MEKVVPFFTRSFWISQIMYGFEFYSKLFEFCLYGFKLGYCAAGDPPVSAPLPCFNGRTMPTPCVGRFRLLSRCRNPLFLPCHVDSVPDPPSLSSPSPSFTPPRLILHLNLSPRPLSPPSASCSIRAAGEPSTFLDSKSLPPLPPS